MAWRLYPTLQQPVPLSIPAFDPTAYESARHTPWSVPDLWAGIRKKRFIAVLSGGAFLDAQFTDPTRMDKWFMPWSERLHSKSGLGVAYHPAFTTSAQAFRGQRAQVYIIA